MRASLQRPRLLLLAVLLVFAGLGVARGSADGDDHAAHGEAAGSGHEGHAPHVPTALEHVGDDNKIELFHTFWPHEIPLPAIPLPGGYTFQITKFMVLELLAAGLVMLCYIPLARHMASGEPARGPFWNALESLLEFVRKKIARPNIGEDKADQYVPFLWTLFLFVLFNNLLGMFPFLGSATANIYVTGGLAMVVFFAIHGSAIYAMGSDPHYGHGHGEHGHGEHGHGEHGHHEHGDRDHGAHGHAEHGQPVHVQKAPWVWLIGSWRYVKSLWPQIDVPIPGVGLLIKGLVFAIEVVGILVRNAVLAVRLFANMFAGHMVLATILLFILMARNTHIALWGTITLSSVLGIVALSLLELFVAFLQAYIFTFLTSLFMGMAINPQH